jgi:hypothetical protein
VGGPDPGLVGQNWTLTGVATPDRVQFPRSAGETADLAERVTELAGPAHHGSVPAVRPFPDEGSIYLDARGGDRALRVTWHQESGLVVLSLWRENVCSGSFRLAIDEVPDLINVLRAGLARSYESARNRMDVAESA